ncbi:MAG TPA: 4-(cytidine 5'-diphospho)-2-C-methyl-D-erythritol kinase [Bryobacteraceae bacterium]|jgi:4-diphosphocytidyl-2-C-methyl-D-erythritol kinase|nr:4-(cytidine 5'-diphospho)-2-C-methyl-D-erythritol kinase [Bryobacteraceae bacterium]
MTAPARGARRARVRALAKINLDLRVLGKRPDGYHELRTIFQTISLADTIDLTFTRGPKTFIEIEDPLQLVDNLAVRAARLALETMGVRGRVDIRLAKRIPMGAGLGGGSSDAAAVLLALPVLAGRPLPFPELSRLAAELGSDVPFFLVGGAAVGIGRGTELFPLPDTVARTGLLVVPDLHVSTAEAYRRLSPRLTTESEQNKIFSFQSLASAGGVSEIGCNDFEAVVMEQYPRLARLKKRLERAGAAPALMSGSGSAIFGLFRTRDQAVRARNTLSGENAVEISLVNRARYRAMWWRMLREHIDQNLWPPPSRYVR